MVYRGWFSKDGKRTVNNARLNSVAFWATIGALLCVAVAAFVLAVSWIGRPFPGFVVLRNNCVDSLASARWTGFQHGIKQKDHILAIDGVSTLDGPALYREVAARPVGVMHTYTVDRPEGGHFKRLSVQVPSQRFDLFDFCGFFLAFWVVGFFHLLVGAFVSIVKPRDAIARAHLLFCIFFGTFFLTNFDGITTQVFTYFPHNEAFALLGAFAVNLAFLVPRPVPLVERYPWIRPLNLIVGILFAGWIAWSYDRAEVWPTAFEALTAVGSVATLIVPISSIWARMSKTSPPQIKSQAQLILWGALIAFLPVIVYNSAAIAGYTIPYGEFTLFGMVIFPATVAYTIIRHKLFDIEVIVKRTVTYAVVTASLAFVYFIVTAGLRSLIHVQSDVLNVIATALVALAFAPMRDRTKALVDKVFFRSGYDLARILTEFGDQARETFDAAHLLKLFVKTLEIALHPAYVAVLLRDGTSGRLQLRESLGLEYGRKLDVAPDDPVLASLLGPEGGSITTGTLDVGGLKEAMALPLRLKNELVGLILVGPRKSDQAYGIADRSLLVNLAQQLSLWVKNAQLFGQLAGQERLKRELEIAREVQAGLLPASLPTRSGVELSAISLPALEVGGDFYDVIAVDEHRLGILIGDVSGKGAPAALLMAMTLVIFRSISRDNLSAADVMRQANELIFLNRPSKKMFVTAFYAVYDPRDRSMSFANAGSPLPFGTTGRLEAKGMSLGVLPSVTYDEEHSTLAPGELVVLYSDGAEDAINPESEQFGEERLGEIVAAHATDAPKDVQEQILEAIRRFSEGSDQFDDITLVTLKAS